MVLANYKTRLQLCNLNIIKNRLQDCTRRVVGSRSFSLAAPRDCHRHAARSLPPARSGEPTRTAPPRRTDGVDAKRLDHRVLSLLVHFLLCALYAPINAAELNVVHHDDDDQELKNKKTVQQSTTQCEKGDFLHRTRSSINRLAGRLLYVCVRVFVCVGKGEGWKIRYVS